ncbi:MAG: hypothetical protein RLP44_19545 [Aggregatilineales bacterium]
MIRKSKRVTATRAIEMVVPFSLDETLEIIESVDGRYEKPKRARWLSVRMKDQDEGYIKFRVRLSARDILGRGVYFCDGELHTESIAPPMTGLTWIARRYRGFDLLLKLLFVTGCIFLAIIGLGVPNQISGFIRLALIVGMVTLPINWVQYRYRRNYIRKKVETRLFDAMNANLGNAD